MREADRIEQLRSELSQDFHFITINYEKNREMTVRIEKTNTDDEYMFAALGYTLHNLYTAFESFFLRIAKFFENNLEQTEWHSALLERMTLRIEGVRPAVIDLDFMNRLGELMRFRHLYRNLYKTPLIPRKVLFANHYAEAIVDDFRPFYKDFDNFLKELKSELEKV